ncbi:MAG TPA: hypothetical protein VJ697_13300, partial [Nitrososphaeraceae archaeon]|nr:hypothetical protein [Nitrososphaeraceae archaeon]
IIIRKLQLSIENLPNWVSTIGTASATIAAVFIEARTFRIEQQNKIDEIERKKNEVLRYVFGILNDNGHRNFRRRIVNLHDEKDEYRKEKILRLMGLSEDEIKRKETFMVESKEIVKADFEQIGSLYKNGEIPRRNFIKIYWREVLKCWLAFIYCIIRH